MTDKQLAHAWLQEKVYDVKREHTLSLVRQAVDSLLAARKTNTKQAISIATVLARTKEIDPDGAGISETGLRGNKDAWEYFSQHRTWQRTSTKPAVRQSADTPIQPVKIDRDRDEVRRRYLRLSKDELVERLISVEQAYANAEETWLRMNDQLLIWRQRAELAEHRLTPKKPK